MTVKFTSNDRNQAAGAECIIECYTITTATTATTIITTETTTTATTTTATTTATTITTTKPGEITFALLGSFYLICKLFSSDKLII